MSTRSRYYPNLYKDSVSLMTVSAKVSAVPGIVAASVVMASATNVENLKQAGLGNFEVRPNDLVVAVSGAEDACDVALQTADELLSERSSRGVDEGTGAQQPISSIQMAVAQDPQRNFALISVPGDYAAAEAMKALRLGMDVMLFSDNVSPESELALKTYARDHDLMVMGPDCGTAIINGVPLGFANAIRRGPIGVVGASGTGTQEVTVRIHQLGSGVSQVLGTGSYDLSNRIGGISMLHGFAALDADPSTKVIVLVSKPPAPEIAKRVLAAAEASAKPVVVIFLGADPTSITRNGVHGAAYLAQAADMAVSLARGNKASATPIAVSNEMRRTLAEHAHAMAPSQRYVRGVFSGGTFCFEAQLIHQAAGIKAFSNTPTAGNAPLTGDGKSRENSIIDMGDNKFTQGRPHPMIDPSQRDARIRDEIDDPTTAVVLFDVVLGYGSSVDPTAGLPGVVGSARARAKAAGRPVTFIAPRLRHRSGSAESEQGDDESRIRGSARGVVQCRGRHVVDRSRFGTSEEQVMKALFRKDLKVVNIGLKGFADDIRTVGGDVTDLTWAPPASADAALGWKLANMIGDPRIEQANRIAYERYLAAQPRLVDLMLARDAMPALAGGERRILHSGPPIAWNDMCGPQQGAICGAILYEGWANSLEAAEALAGSGKIALEPCHKHGAVGPMAGITSPSMPVWVVENTAAKNRACCNLNEGLGKVLRFGANSPDIDRLPRAGKTEVLSRRCRSRVQAPGPGRT